MKRVLIVVVIALLAPGLARAAELPETTAQVKQGRQLFQRSAKGLACATCHSMEGFGNAIGPDLRHLASSFTPRALVMTIHMNTTVYVQEVKLSNGLTFPGIQKRKDNGMVEFWDLSQNPPRLTKWKDSSVAGTRPNGAWQHPPAMTGYAQQELADIVGYLKFVATGMEKEVTVEDLRK